MLPHNMNIRGNLSKEGGRCWSQVVSEFRHSRLRYEELVALNLIKIYLPHVRYHVCFLDVYSKLNLLFVALPYF